MIILKTNHGDISIELDHDNAPVSAENFLQYAKSGHYEGTIFHRVIDGFMIQGGGMDATMAEKSTRKPIANESSNGLSNVCYSLAMARTSDPDSATAQFFINTRDNTFLDKAEAQDGFGYAVFGRVVGGTEVVDAISKVDTGSHGHHQDVPLEPVEITAVEIID